MNLFNFLQTGGFPMDVNVLDRMQTAYQLFNGLGALAGDLSIIKGCELTGNTLSNGVVYINGEVLEFRSGVLSDNVVIVEESSLSTFENGQVKPTHFVRYATFGVATTSYPWASFKRAFPTKDIAGELDKKQDKTAMVAILDRLAVLEAKNAVFQEGGGMVLWNKPAAQIPAGWAEVVNWRGRMPVGWDPNDGDFDTVGETGGAKQYQLTQSNLPNPHGIDIFGMKYDTHRTLTDGDDNYEQLNLESKFLILPANANQPFNIMNPYRVVLFIEFVGL